MLKNVSAEADGYYFIGIGGASMSALAKILYALGHRVGGCDAVRGDYAEELIKGGIFVAFGEALGIEEYSVVIYTDAVSENNSALKKALSLDKRVVPRGQLLYELSQKFSSCIAVAGCHGKTTTCAMLAHIFAQADKKFTFHAGGSDLAFSNAYFGGYDYFLTEACEYKKNFLYLKPDIAVILNDDIDHLDCYSSAESLKAAYAEFASGAKQVVRLYGTGFGGVTFGFDDRADFFAKKIKGSGGRYSFAVFRRGEKLGDIRLSVYGKHNVLNALAATACANLCNISFKDIARGLNSFRGVLRRFERIGSLHGAVCIADYAHHPAEIRAAVKTARQIAEGNIYVVFQPHTYSRTKTLFEQFTEVLSGIKRLMIYKTFAAREYYDDAGSALTLSYAVRRSRYGDCPQDIAEFIARAGEGDIVLFLGAGDIYSVAKNIVRT